MINSVGGNRSLEKRGEEEEEEEEKGEYNTWKGDRRVGRWYRNLADGRNWLEGPARRWGQYEKWRHFGGHEEQRAGSPSTSFFKTLAVCLPQA